MSTRPAPPADRRIEWPTLAIATLIYAGFGLLTWHHHALPGPVAVLLGGYLVAWHGSLQHEVVHGHPTPWPALNAVLVLPCLWLWQPLAIYRRDHLRHHRDADLTDPDRDPESWYVSAPRWARLGSGSRRLRACLDTAAGRLLLAPWVVMASGVLDTVTARGRGRLRAGELLFHLVGVATVLGWVLLVCGIPPLEYLLLYVYPGTALTLLRSFAEHRAHADPGARTCEVRCTAALSLLYLNNNLHRTHHAHPTLPWYEIPARWRERHAADAVDGTQIFAGYGQILLDALRRPRLDQPWDPASLRN